ncbi:MAG: hypothetical protein AAB347_00435 [Bacteroidota bacterium]
MSVEHIGDKLDVIKTTHKIWVKNMLVKTSVHTDTIPALGVLKTETEITDGLTRESNSLITDNASRFVPHLIR